MDKIKKIWLDIFEHEQADRKWWVRKQELWDDRNAEIVKINGNGRLYRSFKYDGQLTYQYLLHLSFLTKQKDQFIHEEHVLPYRFQLNNGKVTNHKKVPWPSERIENAQILSPEKITGRSNDRFIYDRQAAVKYAERWWNSYNPAFEKFAVDCTNYVSQCLYAGGAPMRGAPNRNQGWWYQNNNWSFSWSVAHSLRWYLSGSTQGLQGKEVQTAAELDAGDIICYDFQGDGRWDHNTIVVAKDAYGTPLVNAHTDNSRHRYWSYEDSTAWTPNIKYKFFQIGK